MSELEVKRNWVLALLHAQMGCAEIARIVPCSISVVAKVKKLKDGGNNLKRKPGTGKDGRKRTTEFMAILSKAIEDLRPKGL